MTDLQNMKYYLYRIKMTIEKVKFMSEGLSSLINMLNKKVCKCNLLKKKQIYICIYKNE